MIKSARTLPSNAASHTRPSLTLSACMVFVVLSALPALADLPSTSSPALELARTIRTTPFTGTTISTRDAEGTAYVSRDNSLWLVGDNDRSAFEINPYTGALKRIIARPAFDAAVQFGGGQPAGTNRTGDLESLAYDENSDTLYAFSGTCCSSSALPTVFRLTRVSGQLQVDSYQRLPAGADYTAAAWNGAEDKIYVAKGPYLRTYDYVTNTSGPNFRIRNVSGILGLDFTDDGADLLAVTSAERMFRVNWASKRIVTGWNFDLTPFGVRDSRGVEVIPNQNAGGFDQLYVYDGYSGRATGDPLKYAVFVFDVSGGAGGSELVGNPGFEVDTSGWAGGGVATLSRVSGGHNGSAGAALLRNDGTTNGNCMLNDSPNWVTTTLSRTYTGSLWVKADTAGATLRLRFREYNAGTLVGTAAISTVPLTTSWQQVTVQTVPQAPGTSSLDFTAYVSNALPGTCFYADNASIGVT